MLFDICGVSKEVFRPNLDVDEKNMPSKKIGGKIISYQTL